MANSSYPWSNTGATPYSIAPVWVGEFGTGNTSADLVTSGAGSQGEWFTDMVNFIASSYGSPGANYSGYPVSWLNWTYWVADPGNSLALLVTEPLPTQFPPI